MVDSTTIAKNVNLPLFTEEEIRQVVVSLAKKIQDTYLPEPVNVLSILDGASVFAADLMRQIQLPIRFWSCFAKTYRYTHSEELHGDIKFMGYDDLPKRILIIEDIVDTGKCLGKVVEALVEAGVEDVKICTLLHKGLVSQDDLYCDFVGFSCPSDKFVIGYGMDYRGYYRNLKFITTLKKEF